MMINGGYRIVAAITLADMSRISIPSNGATIAVGFICASQYNASYTTSSMAWSIGVVTSGGSSSLSLRYILTGTPYTYALSLNVNENNLDLYSGAERADVTRTVIGFAPA